LQNQFKVEHKLKSDLTDFQYNFVKVECTSTYPRLIFVLKFLPILGGVGLIQVFSQSKLSRNTENDRSYKEFQISYGSDIKLNTNIDFIYHEPKKLKEIEKFFLEFFILTKQNDDFFYDLNHELKYVDYTLLAIIDEAISHEKISFSTVINNNNNSNNLNLTNNGFIIENILFKINNIYYELYINGNDHEKLKIQDDNFSNEYYFNNRNTNFNNLNDTLNHNVNRQILNTGNANNIFINNNSDSVTLQSLNPNFLQINKELFLKVILNITNKFVYLNVNKFMNNSNAYLGTIPGSNYNNNNKYENTLILSKHEIFNLNNYPYANEQSFDLTNKFSDLSALEDDKYNINYNNTHSNLGMNNIQNNQRANILNNISASFDVILSNLYPRNINTDAGYESQMVTTNMIMANINTININNSIAENPNIQNNNKINFSMAGNLPNTNGNNLNTTMSINDNNLNTGLNNNLNFNTMGNVPHALANQLNTNSNVNSNNVINNIATDRRGSNLGRVNTLGSFGNNLQNTIEQPQISIQNFASPMRNKFIGNKMIPGIPTQPLIGSNLNNNVKQKNPRGSQGPNEISKLIKYNMLIKQQNEMNGKIIKICQ